MTGQKQRIIKRFEREAEIKNDEVRKAGMTCACGKCNLAHFNLKEIIKIINYEDPNEN